MKPALKYSIIIGVLFIAGFIMVESLEVDDPAIDCTEGDIVQVIDGIWACSEGDFDIHTIYYQNITNLPTCEDTEKLFYKSTRFIPTISF